MNKQEFLSELRKGLEGLPKEDLEERIIFYSDMIDDRIEDGLSEEEAIAEIGNIEDVISQIVADIPLKKLVKEKIKPNRSLTALEIILLVLGFPLWFPLLIAGLAIIFSIFAVLWTIVLASWTIFFAIVVVGVSFVIGGPLALIKTVTINGFTLFGAGLFLVGLGIVAFFICKFVTKLIFLLTKKLLVLIKSLFI